MLELTRGRSPAVARLGPDVMADPPTSTAWSRFRAGPQSRAVGDALLDQRLVSGIGNMWKAEVLARDVAVAAAVGPRRRRTAPRARRGGAIDAGRAERRVYRRAGSPVRSLRRAIRSFPQGDEARIAYWCPGCQKERARRGRNRSACPTGLSTTGSRARVPAKRRVLRACSPRSGASAWSAFFDLGLDLEGGADLPIALEEHAGPNRPTLRVPPLVGSFIEQRGGRLALREDAREALAALKDEPAAGIFASAHADERVGEDEALRRTILIPLLVATAEACGGFDWDDDAFERAYAQARGLPLRRRADAPGPGAARRPHRGRDDGSRPRRAGSAGGRERAHRRLARRGPAPPAGLGPGDRPDARPRAGGRARLAGLSCSRRPGRVRPGGQRPASRDAGRDRGRPVVFERLDFRPTAFARCRRRPRRFRPVRRPGSTSSVPSRRRAADAARGR